MDDFIDGGMSRMILITAIGAMGLSRGNLDEAKYALVLSYNARVRVSKVRSLLVRSQITSTSSPPTTTSARSSKEM